MLDPLVVGVHAAGSGLHAKLAGLPPDEHDREPLPSAMTDDRQRLRALQLRTEDVVLLRVLVGIVLRIIGGILIVWALGEGMSWVGFSMQVQLWQASIADLFFTFGRPVANALTGVVVLAWAGPLARRLVPHAITRPRCPACGYHATTLADGRCTECGYAISPVRDGPLSSTDRLVLARSGIAAGLRLVGMAITAWGVGQFVLQGIGDILSAPPSSTAQYQGDRRMLWAVIVIALGISTYALAEKLAGAALAGIGRTPKRKPPDSSDT